MPPRLLSEAELERSAVTANSTMNRGRGLMGPNSYTRDLGFNPVDFLKGRCPKGSAVPPPAWLDLCCGSGRALIEAAERLEVSRPGVGIALVGVDLMPLFDPVPPGLSNVRLVAASLAGWEPMSGAATDWPNGCAAIGGGTPRSACPTGPDPVSNPVLPEAGRGSGGDSYWRGFDLITCVHGLHYVGDKLGLVARAVGWLAPEGRFAAHLDPEHLRWEDGSAAGTELVRKLRRAGLRCDARRHLLTCEGPREVTLPHAFVGADDGAGANYTGQPAVASYYRRAE